MRTRGRTTLDTLRHLADVFDAVLSGRMGVNDITRGALAEAEAHIAAADRREAMEALRGGDEEKGETL